MFRKEHARFQLTFPSAAQGSQSKSNLTSHLWLSPATPWAAPAVSCLHLHPTGAQSPLNYSCLENPMEKSTWWVTVHRVTKSQNMPEVTQHDAHMHVSKDLHSKILEYVYFSLTFSFIIQKYAKIRLLFCKSNQSLGQSMSIYMDISVFITVYQQSLRKFLLHTLFALVAVQSQVVSDSFVIPWTVAHHVHLHGFPRQVYCICHFLLQGIFADQGLNPYLLYWQADCLPLSHWGSPHFICIACHQIRNDTARYKENVLNYFI